MIGLLLATLWVPGAVSAAVQSDTTDIVVTMTGPPSADAGDTIVFEIAVANVGPDEARDIVVQDLLPSELRFVSASDDGQMADRAVTWIVPFLDVGETVVFQVATYVSGRTTLRAAVVNEATAWATAVDPLPRNNSSLVGVVVEGLAGTPDVSVYKTAPDSVGGGDTIVYRIEVENVGDRYTEDVALTDLLPEGTTFLAATPEADHADGVVTWPSVDELRPGELRVFTVTVQAPEAPATLTNVASVTSRFEDSNSSNDVDDATTRVIDPAPLSNVSVTKVGPRSIGADSVIRYTLTISNGGLGVATGVQVLDSLPSEGRFLTASPAPSDTSNGVVAWPVIPQLQPNEVQVFTVDFLAPSDSTELVNVAVIASTDEDSDPTNNRSQVRTIVEPDGPPEGSADLSVSKTPDGRVLTLPADGGAVGDTFRIVVTNQGMGTATDVVLVDTLQPGIRFEPGAAPTTPGTVEGRVVTWRFGDLAADETRTVEIPVLYDSIGTYRNSATASSPSDSILNNNSDTAFVVVTGPLPPVGELGITKVPSRDEVTVGQPVGYTVVVKWTKDPQPTPVTVRDQLPRGFTLVTGTTRLNGVSVPEPNRGSDGALVFPLSVIPSGDSATLEYSARTSAAAVNGDGINTASASSPDVPSVEASAKVRVLPGVFSSEGMIVGSVRSVAPGVPSDSIRNAIALGVPGVRVFLQNGRFTHTDQNGLYSFVGLSPRTWVVRIDETTLPDSSALFALTNRHAGRGASVFVDLTNGELHRADFLEASREPSVRNSINTLRDQTPEEFYRDRYSHVGPGYDVRTGDASRGPFEGLAPIDPALDWETALRTLSQPDVTEIETEVREQQARDSADAPAMFRDSLPPVIAAGVVEARFDLRSLLDGELTGVTERSRFEDALRTYSTTSDDGRRRLGARASLFADGEFGEGNRLTLRLDSEEDRRARFFNDIRPEDGFYSLLGDGSASGYSAQSKGRLFGRWSRGASFGQFGDFTTASGAYGTSGPRTLGEYSRTLNGWLQHYETDRVRVDAFASRDRARQVIDEFPGRGISGPYPLSRAEGLLNSETVELVTRDRNQPGVVLSTARLQRYADYTIEPFSGRIIFKRPVPPTDENFNPITIRVQYEVETGGDKYWIGGASAQAKIGTRLEVGGGLLRDDNPNGRFDLSSVNATLDLGNGTTLTSEYARADSAATEAGGAYRIELRHGSDRINTRLFFLQTDSLFVNPSSPYLAARREFNFLGAVSLRPGTTSLLAEALRTQDRRTGRQITGGRLALDQRLGNWVTGQVGFRYADAEGGNVVSADSLDAVQALGARLTARFPGAPKGSVFAELEQDISFGDRRRAAVGGDYRVFGNTRLYGRHEFIGSLRGPYDPTTLNDRNSTVFGVASDYGTGQSIFSEYRVGDALSGREAQAAVGLRNRWEIREGVRLSASAERLSPLTEGGSTAGALTGAFELTYNPLWKASARAELYSEGDTDRLFGSLGFARKLNDDFTFLARSLFSTELDGGRAFERSQAGFAYRDTDTNRLNLLGQYEHRYERTPRESETESRSSHVLSSHLIVPVIPGFLVRGQWASQFTSESAIVTDGAQNAHLGALRATLDLPKGWDAGLIGRTQFGGGSAPTNFGLGAEIGVIVRCDLRLAAGYNAFGFRDPEQLIDDHTDRGFYIGLGFKFDESLFGFGDSDRSACNRVPPIPPPPPPITLDPPVIEAPSDTADVGVAIVLDSTMVAPGDSVTFSYTVRVSNSGPDMAEAVTLSVARSGAGRLLDMDAGGPSWSIGSLAPGAGQSQTRSVRLRAACRRSGSITARVTSRPFDPNSSNDSASDTLPTHDDPCDGTGAALRITMEGPDSTVTHQPGDVMTFVITTQNIGSGWAPLVEVTAELDSTGGLAFDTVGVTNGRLGATGQQFDWDPRDVLAPDSFIVDTFHLRAVENGLYEVRGRAQYTREGSRVDTTGSATVRIGPDTPTPPTPLPEVGVSIRGPLGGQTVYVDSIAAYQIRTVVGRPGAESVYVRALLEQSVEFVGGNDWGQGLLTSADSIIWPARGARIAGSVLLDTLWVRPLEPGIFRIFAVGATRVDTLVGTAVTQISTTAVPSPPDTITDPTDTRVTVQGPTVAQPGDTVTFIVITENLRDTIAVAVRPQAVRPPFLRFLPWTPGPGPAGDRGDTVSWRPNRDIPPGGIIVDSFRVIVPDSLGDFTIVGRSFPVTEDREANPGDNIYVHPFRVDTIPWADLALRITGTEDGGYDASFRITVENLGNATAFQIDRRLTLPSGAGLLSSSGQATSPDNLNFRWPIVDTLGPGEAALVEVFTASFPHDVATLSVDALVITTTPESNVSNNRGNVVVNIQDTINLPPCAGTCPPTIDWWWLILLLLLLLALLILWSILREITETVIRHRDRREWSRARRLTRFFPLWFGVAGPKMRRVQAFALNREGKDIEAERIVRELVEKEGWNVWNAGHMGRIYKDRFERAWDRDPGSAEAMGLLETSIETYRKGHEPGGAEPYPGLNALTLTEFFDEAPAWRDVLFAEVRDSLKKALDQGLEKVSDGAVQFVKDKVHYWTHASLMELSVLVGDSTTAESALSAALQQTHNIGQIETTLRNQYLIRKARADRGQQAPEWVETIISVLEQEYERLELQK